MHRYHEVRTPLRGFLVSEAQGCNLYSASTSHSELATQRWKLPLPRANGSKSQRPSTDIRCAGGFRTLLLNRGKSVFAHVE